MRQLLLLILFGLLLLSCAPESSGPSEPTLFRPNNETPEEPGPTPRPRSIPPVGDQLLPEDPPANSEIVRAQSTAQIDCQGECNESVGYIFGYTIDSDGDRESYVCTGALVGPNAVLTNSHCIPDDLKAGRAKCTDRLSIRFPKTSKFESEAYYCAEILLASEIDNNLSDNKDYAIFTINHVPGRKVLKWDRSGFDPNERFTYTKVNPIIGPIVRGRMETWDNCRPIMGTVVAPIFTDKMSHTVTAFNCPVMGGNSGSPVFGANGKIRGVIYGGVPEENIAAQGLRQYGPVQGDVALITSLACLDWPGFGPLPKECTGMEGRSQNARRQNHSQLMGDLQLADEQAVIKISSQLYGSTPLKPQVSSRSSITPAADKRGLEFPANWTMEPACVLPSHPEFIDNYWGDKWIHKVKVTHKVSLDAYWRPSVSAMNSLYEADVETPTQVRQSGSRYEYRQYDRWQRLGRCRPGLNFSLPVSKSKVDLTNELHKLIVY